MFSVFPLNIIHVGNEITKKEYVYYRNVLYMCSSLIFPKMEEICLMSLFMG